MDLAEIIKQVLYRKTTIKIIYFASLGQFNKGQI